MISIFLGRKEKRDKGTTLTFAVCESDGRGYVCCNDYFITVTQRRNQYGGQEYEITKIEEEQNGPGAAGQGGVNWKEGDSIREKEVNLSRILVAILNAASENCLEVTDRRHACGRSGGGHLL